MTAWSATAEPSALETAALDDPLAAEESTLNDPVGADTTLVCALALLIVRFGMRVVLWGTRLPSAAHPGATAYRTAVLAWRERTGRMAWGGLAPTQRRFATWTQLAWLIAAIAALNTAATLIGLPHVPLVRLLTGHPLPHVDVELIRPRR